MTLLAALLLLALLSGAQSEQTYTVNSIKDNKEELVKDVFRYPQFLGGVAVNTAGTATPARFNYHRLFDQVFFISPGGDTLVLARPETFTYIAMGSDTFFVQEGGFVERMTHYSGINLAKKSTIKAVSTEKKGLYDTYSSTISAGSKSAYAPGGNGVMRQLQVDENTVFRSQTRYYLSDGYNNFFPASKKHFYNLFFRQEKQLKDYLDTHAVNFGKEKDLLALITYLQGASP